MELDETWIRAHLPPESADARIDCFSEMYLDGLTVMAEGERGGPDTVVYRAKDEADLRWWQLEQICRFLPEKDPPEQKTWRWARAFAKNDRWYYTERRHYDYNAIEDARLHGFECFLRNLKAAGFPPARWEEKVREHVHLMNYWYASPHWDYDRDRLCFIEISDSREHDGGDGAEEPRPGSVIRIIDDAEEDGAMPTYSEQDLKHAAEFREGVHREALAKLRETNPELQPEDVVDRWPVEAYFEDNWEYPGRWYTYVAVPPEAGGRKKLIDTIVRDTLSQRTEAAQEQTRQLRGKKLDAKHYDYEKLFTVSLDQESRACTLVGRDAQGRFILEDYKEYSRGGATGSVSEYYVLTYEEYRRCAKQALSSGMITREEYRLACEGPDGEVVYRDGRYTLGQKNDRPYLRAGGKDYLLSCHPYEPCLYITDWAGDMTAVHNAFDPSDVLRDFAKGRTVTSITGREYSARDFCEMVEYAAGRRDISISDAECVFDGRPAPARAVPAAPAEDPAAEKALPETELPETPLPEATPFSLLYSDYPDAEADIYIVKDTEPCRGLASHRRALAAVCRALAVPDDDGAAWRFDVARAQGRPVSADAPFAPLPKDGGCNLRKAVLRPPHGSRCTAAKFDALCAALFPAGRSRLEVFDWSTDWSDYFDDGHEWWGAMCCTVYDRSLDRYVVMLASATD